MTKENTETEELKNENKSQEEVNTGEACDEKDAATESESVKQEAEIDPLEKAEAEIADLKKQLLYKIAEFDNYRKRTMAEKVDLIMNGGEKTITAILPVMDDMERALEQMKKAEDVSAVVEGVELIRKKFMGILEKLGVKAIETDGAEFDVDLHEAIAQLPAPTEDMKNKIIDCTLKGYKLNDKVIRHSQVVVGM